jgi:ATP-dependent Zn protease
MDKSQAPVEVPPGVPPPPPPSGRPRDEDRLTRKPLSLWDRIKFILLLILLWFILVWSIMASNPLPGFSDAALTEVRAGWWVFVLLGLEVIRQVHFLISERSARYHRFWTHTFFGGFERVTHRRISDWSRFRIWRLLVWVFWIAVVAVVVGKIIHTTPILALLRAPQLLWKALPFVLQLAFAFFFIAFQFIGLFWLLSRGGVDVYYPDDIKTRFSDVWGQDHVLERVKENIIFLENPELVEERGGYVPGGILLWGPPGTGKTLMAQAAAGETGRPFVAVEPAAFINMFMGVGVLKVKALYRKLRKLALRYGGVIVFFDEADSLGNRGQTAQPGGWSALPEFAGSPWTTAPACNGIAYLSPSTRAEVLAATFGTPSPPRRDGIIAGMGGLGGGGMGTLQALLSEMDGLKKPRGFINRHVRRILGMRPKPPPKYRILHIFATNMPQALDEAMLRPGRIDRQYKVGYPQKNGRKETLEYYLAKVKHELTPEQVDKLATISPYASGADIKDIVNEGLVIAIRDGRESITYRDIVLAKQLKEHGLPDDHEYIDRERHSVAVHEACHAVAAYRLRKHAVIDMATIERRGDVGGFVSSIPPEDQFVTWRSERETDVMTSLASLAGERMFFGGDHSTGVGGDMRGATAVVTQMHAYAAMGPTIAARSVTLGAMRGAQPAETGADRQLYDTEFGKGVEASLQELYDRTWRLLEENRAEVLTLAHALETHKTIAGEDVAAVIEGTEGPIVDGRPYTDAFFRDQLEAYHEAVLRAHAEHAGVEAQVPVPLPPPPPLTTTGDGNGARASLPAAEPELTPIREREDDPPA